MNTVIPTQEFIIDYPVNDVKAAIELFIDDLNLQPDGYYHARTNSNTMFNLYAFNIWKNDFLAGMVTGDMKVSLQDVNGEKTKIIINSIAKTQGPLDNSRIMDIQSAFLKKLQTALNGEYVKPSPAAVGSGSGCLLMMSVLALITVVYYFQ